MIVQSAPENQPHFVILQTDHTKTCGQLARAFGNQAFELPAPQELLISVVENHDAGWAPIDARLERSPETGLPHHLNQTPLGYLVQTSKGSPDFNESRHPYTGLLSSMHTFGLFNGRYGLSDFIFIDKMTGDYKAAAQEMLQNEQIRQAELKNILQSSPETAGWIEESRLFTHYKLLQFFDTLALYFQMTHAGARKETSFLNVPDGKGQDHTLTILPLENGAYRLSPYPFAEPAIEVQTEGRYLSPQPPGADFAEIFKDTPVQAQTCRIVAEAE